MDQLRIIFKTLQSMKSSDEEEIGLDQKMSSLEKNLKNNLGLTLTSRNSWYVGTVTTFPKMELASFYLPQIPFSSS